MIDLSKKEIFFQLKAMGINSIFEHSFYYEKYREYSEKTLQEHFGYVFKKKDIYQKRAHKRIPTNLAMQCCDIKCYGTITNLSHFGMFIESKKISFPLKTEFKICVPINKREISMKVKICRITKANGYYDGIGVKLINPPEIYFDFVNSLKKTEY